MAVGGVLASVHKRRNPSEGASNPVNSGRGAIRNPGTQRRIDDSLPGPKFTLAAVCVEEPRTSFQGTQDMLGCVWSGFVMFITVPGRPKCLLISGTEDENVLM
jgi:hypothetical protein